MDETSGFPGARFVSVDTPVLATSTPKVKMSSGDDHLYILTEELKGLKRKLATQEKMMAEMSESFQHTTKKDPLEEKGPLPPEYDGSTDFCTYRVQFEVLARQQKWNEEKQGVMLLSRLKGRALDVAAQGEDLSYPGLVERLKSHFSPEHEEMFAQKLQALRKTSSQTWEDLAFEVRTLTRKAYGGANDSTKERLGVHAFVNAITDDEFRKKVRDAHPFTVQAALDRVRQVEADQAIEQQRHHQTDGAKGTIHVVHTEVNQRKMEDLESEVEELRSELRNKLRNEPNQNEKPRAGRVPRPGADARESSRGRGSQNSRGKRLKCYFCDSTDHLLRDCPYKMAWRREHKASQSKKGTMPGGSEQPLNY